MSQNEWITVSKNKNKNKNKISNYQIPKLRSDVYDDIMQLAKLSNKKPIITDNDNNDNNDNNDGDDGNNNDDFNKIIACKWQHYYLSGRIKLDDNILLFNNDKQISSIYCNLLNNKISDITTIDIILSNIIMKEELFKQLMYAEVLFFHDGRLLNNLLPFKELFE